MMGFMRKIIPYKVKKRIKRILGYEQREFTAEKEYILNINSTKRFENKVAIITGGSGAIGRAVALRLAIEGAKVYVTGRTESNLVKVVDEIKNLGGKANFILLDVNDSETIEKAFKSIGIESNIDILVNCAGGSSRGQARLLHEQDEEIVKEVIMTNLLGSMYCSRQAAKYMVKQGSGKIINVSSAVGMKGKAKFTDYAAAKAGIIGYTKSLAIELGKYGITVNCITPGFIQRGVFNEEAADKLMSTNYLRKIGTLEDVASLIAYVASDEANFITGENMVIDGGRTLGLLGDRYE